MNDIDLFPKELVNSLGWTFIHSLWQGLLLFVILTILLVVFRRFSSSTKYNISVSFLFLFLASTVVTFSIVYEPTNTIVNLNPTSPSILDHSNTHEIISPEFKQTNINILDLAIHKILQYTSFKKFFPTVIGFWLLGITILSIKYLGSWIFIRKLRNQKVKPIDTYWENKCLQLGEKLRLSKKYIVRFSNTVTSPMVIGFFKPVILLPIKLITRLPEKQIEAILIHELAHIKRNDYLINIIQIIMEVVFFYHPAIWSISSRIRTERENCCDDFAVSITCETINYAEALVNIGNIEIQNNFGLAFAGNQHKLKLRVQRMFTDRTLIADFKEKFVTLSIILLSFCSLGWTALVQLDENEEIVIQENNPQYNKTISSQQEILQLEETNIIDNSQNHEDSQAIFEFIRKGNIEAVKTLIKTGINLEVEDKKGGTPLLLAVKDNKYEIAKLLIKNGADVSFIKKNGQSILIEAADEKDHRLTELLLEKGVDIDYYNSKYSSALFEAICKGNTKVVKILLKEGADIEATNKNGHNALMCSIDKGKIEIAHILIEAGANVHFSKDNGWTILMEAALRNSPGLIRTLLSKEVNVNALSNKNHSALNGAVRRENTENARLLIEHGADVNRKYEGYTPLQEAVKRNNYELTKLLLDNGSEIEIREISSRKMALQAGSEERKK